jgi:hypothetical protein
VRLRAGDGPRTKDLELVHRPPIHGSALQALRSTFRGSLIAPADEGYDPERRVRNAMIDRHPALIARCLGASDVARAPPPRDVDRAGPMAVLGELRGLLNDTSGSMGHATSSARYQCGFRLRPIGRASEDSNERDRLPDLAVYATS